MQSTPMFGWPWWAWPLLALLVGALAGYLRKGSLRTRHREAAEALAQKADADHEGAQTRHEGGA